MELRVFRNGGVSVNGRPMPGLTVQAPVELLLIPTYAKEVVCKDYVDNINFSLATIDKITSGYVALSTFKSRITGDVVIDGSNQLNIVNAITAGTFSKVTVNAKGLITGTTALTAADIPNLAWSKVTLNKPTTAEGYGITNALLTGNTTVSANYTLVQHPASNKEAATYGVADWWRMFIASEKNNTGDIVLKPTSTTPSGYLRCNGAAVSTTTYAALYAVIGLNGGASPPANTFYLPNLTANETQQYYYYIKT